MNQYHDVNPIDKEAAEKMLSSDTIELVCQTMVSIAFHESDWHWAQDKFLKLLFHKNHNVSGLAATCLGHLARIHNTLEKDRVIRTLKMHLNNSEIAGRIEDALDDIKIYVRHAS